MRETICRYKDYIEEKVTVETKTTKGHYYIGNGGFSHCLYLHFNKKDYPHIKYPVNGNYYESDFMEIGLHRGCTFYEESIDAISMVVRVKVGCDYLHYGDDEFGESDNGIQILIDEADTLVKNLVEINKKREINR